MNRNTFLNRATLVANFARLFPLNPPHWLAQRVLDLAEQGKRANAAAVALCNGDIDQDTFDRRKHLIRSACREILAELPGVTAEIGGDPRGYAFYIHCKGLRGNTFGGDEQGYGLN